MSRSATQASKRTVGRKEQQEKGSGGGAWGKLGDDHNAAARLEINTLNLWKGCNL